jgi:hypothetical protein
MTTVMLPQAKLGLYAYTLPTNNRKSLIYLCVNEEK